MEDFHPANCYTQITEMEIEQGKWKWTGRNVRTMKNNKFGK
jgi:hypothetical protein